MDAESRLGCCGSYPYHPSANVAAEPHFMQRGPAHEPEITGPEIALPALLPLHRFLGRHFRIIRTQATFLERISCQTENSCVKSYTLRLQVNEKA